MTSIILLKWLQSLSSSSNRSIWIVQRRASSSKPLFNIRYTSANIFIRASRKEWGLWPSLMWMIQPYMVPETRFSPSSLSIFPVEHLKHPYMQVTNLPLGGRPLAFNVFISAMLPLTDHQRPTGCLPRAASTERLPPEERCYRRPLEACV